MDDAHRQRGYRLRLDWGQRGAAAVADGVDVAVVVDVLSFTTTLSVALDAGITVLPYRWEDDTARAYAADHDAVLAVARSQASPGEVSLSPGTIRDAAGIARLVLPSPNGATIIDRLAAEDAAVVGASLRNARAVAEWIAGHLDPHVATVGVVAAGEQWPDGTLRPAVEDLWGAGALIAGLVRAGWSDIAPEAAMAVAAHTAVAADIRAALRACASGQELINTGFGDDVDIAADADASSALPKLRHGEFAPNQ